MGRIFLLGTRDGGREWAENERESEGEKFAGEGRTRHARLLLRSRSCVKYRWEAAICGDEAMEAEWSFAMGAVLDSDEDCWLHCAGF